MLFKYGIMHHDGEGVLYYAKLITNVPVMLGFCCYGLSFLIWMWILKYFDVSYARSLTSVGYIVTYLLALFLLNEPLLLRRFLGICIITLGVVLLK